MVFYKGRHGADLHGVGVIGRVLEESVVRVKELLRQKEEEFSRRTTVVQAAKGSRGPGSSLHEGGGGPVSMRDLACLFRVSARKVEGSLCSLQWIPREV